MAEKHRYNRGHARTKLLLHKFIIPIRSYLNQLFLEEQSRLPSVSCHPDILFRLQNYYFFLNNTSIY